MRTANICPTCATFENALCVLYNGAYLTNTKISPLDSLETALIKINANLVPLTGIVAPTANATYLGQQYLNTVTKQLYYAKAINTGASDWTLSVNGTAGQVGFYSSQYNVIGDNSLFWDNSNKRLGIGTIIPSYKLDVDGNGRFTSSVIATYFQNTGQNAFYLTNAGNNDFTLTGSGAFRILNNTQLTSLFSVNNAGVATFSNTVNAANFYAAGGISTAGDSTFNEVRIGKGVGQINSNTLVGQYSLTSNTTGYQNTVLGFTAMTANTVGYQNTAVGAYSLTANLGGHENVAVGDYALTANTSGYDNVGIGARSLISSITGYRNVAIGKEAMLLSTGASQSVAIGYQALVNGATDSVAVGFKAGYDGGTNIVAIGFESLAVNTGINNTGVGYRSLYTNSTGTLNTGLGYHALRSNSTGLRNTGIGGQALYANVTGSYNIGVGYDAGRYVISDGGAANTGSTSCIYIGYKSLAATATDTNAIVIGNDALSLGSNTTVIGNGSTTKTAIRGNVLIGNVSSNTGNTAKLEVIGGSSYFETSEDSNAFVIYNGPNAETAVRYDSDSKYLFLQENNGPVILGASSPINSDKLQVVGNGYFTNLGGANLSVVSTISGNASLTLTSNTTGSQKAIINAPLASGKLVLQTNTVDRITIGSTGNTWIGGTSTFTSNTAKLEVLGSIASSTLTDTTYERYIFADTTGRLTYSNTYAIGVERVLIGAGGNPNAIATLEVNLSGGAESVLSLVGNNTGYPLLEGFQNPGTLVFYVADTGEFYATSYNIYSDRKLKENIVSTTSKLDDLMKVNVVNYNLINDKNKSQQVGVIAQEVEEIFPTLISEDKNGIKGVNVSSLIPILIKGMQEQQDIIKNLQTQIDELKSKI